MTALAIGTVVTAAVIAIPSVHVAYRSPTLHVAADTAAGVVALLAAYLIYGRFKRSRSAADAVLAVALMVFSLTDLLFGALGSSLSALQDEPFLTWSTALTRLIGIAGLVISGLLGDRPVSDARRAMTSLGLGLVGALSLLYIALALMTGRLPIGIDPNLSPSAAGGWPPETGSPAILVIQLVAAALFAWTAIGFQRRAIAGQDMFRWFAAGAVLAAFARAHYFLFPSLYSEWFYTGDVLRIGFYAFVLVGAAREIRGYWEGAARSAALEERNKVARDLHDGLAHELLFISIQSKRLRQGRGGAMELDQLTSSSDRALFEARRAITALSSPLDRPLSEVLTQEARLIADRSGLDMELELDDGIDISEDAQESLLRIVREAVTNAAKHAAAQKVRVELHDNGALHLGISDDGIGFDPSRPPPADGMGGFGLVSMKERAAALGGSLKVESGDGRGTRIEVTLPSTSR